MSGTAAHAAIAVRMTGIHKRFGAVAANADVAIGDLLTTSGVDGVYPRGLPVARVEKVERRVDAVFARIDCVPLAAVAAAGHVLVLEPVTAHIPARPAEETSPAPPKRGAVK